MELLGSYGTRTAARPRTVVDVGVEIPRQCLHEKDQLDQRYHAKRALFLVTVANSLAQGGLFGEQSWEAFLGDHRWV